LNSIYMYDQELADLADEEKAIPWAEGNGLWRQVSRLADDLVGVDLITLFVQNPYTCDSAKSLAVRISRPPEQVEPVLENLASTGLLKKTELGDLCVYGLTDDPRRRQTLQQYVSWLQEGFHWIRMALDR
jgi:hypothetical protein